LKEEGFELDIVYLKKGKIKRKHGYEVEVDKTLKQVDHDDTRDRIQTGYIKSGQ
jgi:hypothetical protein